MGYFATRSGLQFEHNIDLSAELAHRAGWSLEASDENHAILSAPGLWRTYQLGLSWIGEQGAFLVESEFPLRARPTRLETVFAAIREFNDRTLFGGFSYDIGEGMVRFRYALAIDPEAGVPEKLVGRLVDVAVESCDRLYPAIRVAASTDRDPAAVLQTAMLDTVGCA